jgi:serine/threonine protein kinase
MQGETCPSDEQLVAHVVGDLAEGERDAIRAHLDSCELCRAVLVGVVRATPAGKEPELAPTLVEIRKLRAEAYSDDATLPARYSIDRLLGQGGMGRVFAAHDRELDRPVAVKVMRPELASESVAERLVRESRAMAKLAIPASSRCTDVGRHDRRVYLAMELIDAVTPIRPRAKRRSRREIVDVFCRAGEGLAAAHAAGLIHRDVKPENVLLALDGECVRRVAVSDFGVATAAREQPVIAPPSVEPRPGPS